MNRRRIAVLTVARSDFGIYRPILREIERSSVLELQLMVSGTHLSPEDGPGISAPHPSHGPSPSIQEILAEGYKPAAEVASGLAGDSPRDIARASGALVSGLADALDRLRPDLLMLLGDRYEMHAGALAALPFTIPVVHIHGGEVTEGAFDDALRHSMTKLSHIHFASTQEYADRIVQMGEEPWRVHVSGAPAIDNLRTLELRDRRELEAIYGFTPDLWEFPVSMVTYHPVTLEYRAAVAQIELLLGVLGQLDHSFVFSGVNADTHGSLIEARIVEFVKGRPRSYLVPSFGIRNYFSMLSLADYMIGNSSSGILEAPIFELPTVNIGSRQAGRVRAANVIDVGYAAEEILEAVSVATSAPFRRTLKGLTSPYGSGGASESIVRTIEQLDMDNPDLTMKKFIDSPRGGEGG